MSADLYRPLVVRILPGPDAFFNGVSCNSQFTGHAFTTREARKNVKLALRQHEETPIDEGTRRIHRMRTGHAKPSGSGRKYIEHLPLSTKALETYVEFVSSRTKKEDRQEGAEGLRQQFHECLHFPGAAWASPDQKKAAAT